jgi:hypothetical protein
MVDVIDEPDMSEPEPVIDWLNATPAVSWWDTWFASSDLDDHAAGDSIHHRRRRQMMIVDRDRRV